MYTCNTRILYYKLYYCIISFTKSVSNYLVITFVYKQINNILTQNLTVCDCYYDAAIDFIMEYHVV